jgi:FtsP/CotA-like multicopper oxidase with cupredoxin domain
MVYTFRADPRGTSFWHAHFREELEDGIYGPLIVEDPPNSFPFHYDQEIVVMMTDAYNLTSWEQQAVLLPMFVSAIAAGQPASDPTPDQSFLCAYDETTNPPTPSCSSTTDGKGFNINFQPGLTYRLRLICSSQLAPFLFSIDEHELQVVSTDFTVLNGNAWVQSVPLMVHHAAFYLIILSNLLRFQTGQRYDVLVRAKKHVPAGTKFWARATMQGQCGK